jgi:hypothetical protein
VETKKLYTDWQLKEAFLSGVATAYFFAMPEAEREEDEEEASYKADCKATADFGDDWRNHLRLNGCGWEEEFRIAEFEESVRAQYDEQLKKAWAALPKPGAPRSYPPIPPSLQMKT